MNDVEISSLISLVKAQAEATKTIVSDFTQYQHLEFLSNDIESSGKLSYKSPAMVRWEYLKPDPYTVLFKNEILLVNQNGKKSTMNMGANEIFKQLNHLIMASISGDMFDTEKFSISYFKVQEGFEVRFKPNESDFAEFINAVHLTFNKKGEVIQVKMLEPSEDYTQIVFKNRKTNIPLSDTIFTN